VPTQFNGNHRITDWILSALVTMRHCRTPDG
jgi:hypothetical protein